MWLFVFSFIIGYVSGQQYSNVYYPQTQTYRAYHNNNNQPNVKHTHVPVVTQQHGHGHYTHTVPVSTHQHYIEPDAETIVTHTTAAPHLHHGYYSQSHETIHNPSILRYENTNEGDGNYHYAYETVDGLKQEEQSYYNGLDRVVRGFYSYIGPNSKEYTVHYYADDTGFHARGDHLPTSN